MFCTNCGTKNKDNSKFCANCGSKIESSVNENLNNRVQNNFNNVNQAQANKTNMNNNFKNTNVNNNSSQNPNNINNSYNSDPLERFSNTVDNFSNNMTRKFQRPNCRVVTDENFRYEMSGIKALTLSSNIDTSQVKRTQYNHPYSSLGGFLAFIVYGGLVGIILECIALIVTFIAVIQFMFLTKNFWITIALVIGIPLAIILAVVEFRFLMKIKHKDLDFLHFFHKICVYSLIFYVIFEVIYICTQIIPTLAWLDNVSKAYSTAYKSYGSYNYASQIDWWSLMWWPILEIVLTVVFCILGIFLETLYFIKSVRVRTYMGSDKYAKLSFFTKNAKVAQPADYQYNYSQENNFNNNNNTNVNQNFNSSNPSNMNNNNFTNSTSSKVTNNTVFCTKCGTPVKDNNMFCTKCGSRIKR